MANGWQRFWRMVGGKNLDYGEDTTAGVDSALQEVQDKYGASFAESGRRGSGVRSGLKGSGDVGYKDLLKDEELMAYLAGDSTTLGKSDRGDGVYDRDSAESKAEQALVQRLKDAGIDLRQFGKAEPTASGGDTKGYDGVKKEDLLAFIQQKANPYSALGDVMEADTTATGTVNPLDASAKPATTQSDAEKLNAVKKKKKVGDKPSPADLRLNDPEVDSVKRI